MKKSLRKLIPTFVMLVITAALIGTSTFAWFSMNKTVTVTGMQVEVKSNNTFLLVNTGSNDTAAEIQTAGVTTVPLTVTDLESKVYPSSPILADYVSATAETNNGTHKYFANGTTTVTDYATAAVEANWFTAQNNNPGNSNDSVKNVTALTDSNFSQYVIKRTAYLTVAAGADAANTLTVTGTILPKGVTATEDTAALAGKTYYSYADGVYTKLALEVGDSVPANSYAKTSAVGDGNINLTPVKVLVVTNANNIVTLDYSTTSAQSLHEVADTSITDSTVVTVDIYIYYDGEAAPVYTNNIANLAAASIELAFDVEVAS